MHSPFSSSGADARASYTVERPENAGNSVEFKDSQPFMGKAFMSLVSPRGRGADAGQAVVEPVEGVKGDYLGGWEPSPSVTSSLGNVNNHRRLLTPPLHGDNPFRPLREWLASERAHERPAVRCVYCHDSFHLFHTDSLGGVHCPRRSSSIRVLQLRLTL
jgi:hypothetical protein